MRLIERLYGRPGVLFLLLALWLSLEQWGLGPYSYMPIHDIGDITFPRLLMLASAPFLEKVCYWLPGMACGVDRLSNDLLYTHVYALAFRFLPGWFACGAMAVLQGFLCSYFAYRLAKEGAGLSEVPALFTGFALVFYTDLSPGYQMAYVLLPFMLWSFERICSKPWPAALFGVIGLGLLNASCTSAVTALPFCLMGFWLWFGFIRRCLSVRFIALLCVFTAVSLGAHIVEVWAIVLNAPWSHRADWTPLRPSAVDMFWGAFGAVKIPLLLAVAGLVSSRGRAPRLKAFLGVFLFCTLGAQILELVKAPAGAYIGFLKGFNFVRLERIGPLFLILAAAEALAWLPWRNWVLGSCVTVLLLGSIAVKLENAWTWVFQGGYTANYSSPVLRSLAGAGPPGTFRVAVFSHGLHPAFANVYGLETVDGYLNLYPKTYQRFWSKVIEPLTRRSAFFDQGFNGWGNRIYLFFDNVARFPEGIVFADNYRLSLLSLANARYVVSRHPLLDDSLVALDPPVPWESMSSRAHLWLRVKENFTGKRYLYVYENRGWLPRAFIASRVQAFPDAGTLGAALAVAPAERLRREVFLETRFAGDIGALAAGKAEVLLESYGADRIEYSVRAEGPGLLVVSNSFSPFWKCSVDGVAREVLPAYGAFWAVALPASARRVVFEYRPPYRLF